MSELSLEVVEGPDAGRTASLAGTIEIGRDPSAGLVLNDQQASRRHARIRAQSGGAVVEDLGSSNGTFVNSNELHAPTLVTAGDEVLIGVSVIQVRSVAQIAVQASAVRSIPPGLAAAPQRPTFVDPKDGAPAAPKGKRAEGTRSADGKQRTGVPELDRLVDSRVKAQTKLAPLALIVLVALVVLIYFGATS